MTNSRELLDEIRQNTARTAKGVERLVLAVRFVTWIVLAVVCLQLLMTTQG
jgi:hypothetical protein